MTAFLAALLLLVVAGSQAQAPQTSLSVGETQLDLRGLEPQLIRRDKQLKLEFARPPVRFLQDEPAERSHQRELIEKVEIFLPAERAWTEAAAEAVRVAEQNPSTRTLAAVALTDQVGNAWEIKFYMRLEGSPEMDRPERSRRAGLPELVTYFVDGPRLLDVRSDGERVFPIDLAEAARRRDAAQREADEAARKALDAAARKASDAAARARREFERSQNR